MTPGSIVAVLVLRSPLMVATLLGVLKAGAGYLPLDHHHPEGRIAFMLEDAAVKVMWRLSGYSNVACIAVRCCAHHVSSATLIVHHPQWGS